MNALIKRENLKQHIGCSTITGVNGKQKYQYAVKSLNYWWTFGMEPIASAVKIN